VRANCHDVQFALFLVKAQHTHLNQYVAQQWQQKAGIPEVSFGMPAVLD
jgi:hypothetical protein